MPRDYSLYNRLYKLVANPKTKDLKIKSYESLIYYAFLNDGGNTSVERILQIANEDLNIAEPSKLIIDSIIAGWVKEGKVEKRGNSYALDKTILSYIEKESHKNKEEYEEFISHVLSSVNNLLDNILRQDERGLVTGIINRTLFEIFRDYTDNIVEIYGGTTSSVPIPQLEEIINRAFKETLFHDPERRLEIQEAFTNAIKKLFYNPTEKFSIGLRQLANRHLACKVIQKNPPTEKISENIFKEAKLYLDTNILISYLCEKSHLHDVTVGLIRESAARGVKFYVTNWTKIEFYQALDNANNLYNYFKKGKLKAASMENEILKTYLNSPQDESWGEYLQRISNEFENLDKNGPIEFVDCDTSQYGDKVESIRYLIDKSIERSPDLILHDAKMIAYVQYNRKDITELTVGTSWFFTRHYILKEIERKNLRYLKYKFGSIITPDIWFEILLPFVSESIDEKGLSIHFSKLIANAIMPLPFDIVDDFIVYLSNAINLPKENEGVLREIIERTHIRKSLEESIKDGDTETTYELILAEIKEKLSQTRENERLKETIQRMASEMRVLKKVKPEAIISVSKLEILKKQVLQAKDPDSKGKSLEKLISYLMESINGIEIIDTRLRLEAEEIDILLSNNAFIHWGGTLIVECKNWSKKVNSKEIVVFKDNMRKLDCSTGIFVAFSGITGDDYSNAQLIVREALQESRHIIVLNWDDIEKVEDGDTWIKLLKHRYHLPQKMAINTLS